MSGSVEEWEQYAKWNDAIAAVVYPKQTTAIPVYLDLEDTVLESIRDRAEPDSVDPQTSLIEAVKGTLDFGGGPAAVLQEHLVMLEAWYEQETLEPPPTLALLAVLSLAAEQMHHGDGKAAHNFYGRLAELLDLNETEIKRFTDAYRKVVDGEAVSSRLWSSLNVWLEELEGNRGLPTAFAIGHDHIGLPLSQALVREADRVKFADMFASYGLPPYSSYPPDEMQEIIAEWLGKVPCPASHTLEHIWKKNADARDRIVDVARMTLETWDGTSSIATPTNGDDSKVTFVDMVRAKVTLRSFPSQLVEISLVVPARTDAGEETLDVLDSDDQVIGSLDLVPSSSGWLGLADPSEMSAASFLDGETRLRRTNQALPLRRRPRRLVPLRRDLMLQAFVECERLQLGEDCLLLVRAEIAPKVQATLAAVARPGFVVHTDLAGLPDCWVCIEGVQVLSSIPPEQLYGQLADLNMLQPLAVAQVLMQGGMRLPGNLPKWLSGLAPEVRASTDSGSSLTAHLHCTRPMATPVPPDRERHSDEAVLIWDLAAEYLPDGDYEIQVLEDDGGELCRPQTLRLRSADHPAVVIEADLNSIEHDPVTPAFGLIAGRTCSDSAFRGVPDAGTDMPTAPPPDTTPGWWVARQTPRSHTGIRQPVQFASVDPKSCMVTGAHLMAIDTAHDGQKTVDGVCKYCGLVKRYPTTGKKKRTKKGKTATKVAPHIDVHSLDPVKTALAVDWRLGFDALCHVGGGPMSALSRIALQMEPTGLFGDTFTRRLEVLGHIEIERDPTSLLERSWEIIEPMLLGLPAGDLLLSGFRSEASIAAIDDVVHRAKAELIVDDRQDAPPVVRIVGLNEGGVKELASKIEDVTQQSVRHVADAAATLASRLRPLSSVLHGLPTTSMIGAKSYERWDPHTARFEPADAATSAGAFRLRGFTRAYIYRRPQDLGAMTALLGDARIVKHAAALSSGVGLIGYDADASVLYVPLGADLPGLYGRAAVLASGYPPRENSTERILEYPDVPPALAGRLADLLMS